MQYVNALSPPIAGERVGVEGWMGWKWAPIGGLQYQTHMQAPKYDVQFLRSETLRSSSSSSSSHRRQPRWGCRGRIPTNILVGGDINRNVPTNIRGGNVVEYELLIASVKRKQR